MLFSDNRLKPLNSLNPIITTSKRDILSRIVDALKWILWHSSLFGLITFKFENDKFTKSTIRCVIYMIAICINIPLTLFGCYSSLKYRDNILYKTTDILTMLVGLFYVLTVCICSILNRDKFLLLLVRIIDIDWEFSHMGINFDYCNQKRKIKKKVILRLMFVSSSIGVMIYGNLILQDLTDAIISISNSVNLLVDSALALQTIELVGMLKTRFRIVNSQITKIIRYYKKPNVNVIEKFNIKEDRRQFLLLCKMCTLHHELSKLIKLFNEAFGFMLLMLFTTNFILIVMAAFYCIGQLQQQSIDLESFIYPIAIFWTLVLDTVLVCHVCYEAILEANKAGKLIHRIQSEDRDIKEEIGMFALQIANERVEFNAADFFPINHTLLFSIIGGVTTYIVILIQLSATLVKPRVTR